MKKERIEFVLPTGLKAKLQKEASQLDISVGELIRQRFEPSNEERELKQAVSELRALTKQATGALAKSLAEADRVIAYLHRNKKLRKIA